MRKRIQDNFERLRDQASKAAGNGNQEREQEREQAFGKFAGVFTPAVSPLWARSCTLAGVLWIWRTVPAPLYVIQAQKARWLDIPLMSASRDA